MKLQDIELPCIGSVTKGETDQKGKSMSREETLVSTGMRLQIFWKSSAYFLEEETVPKSKQASFVFFFFKNSFFLKLCLMENFQFTCSWALPLFSLLLHIDTP